MGKKLVSIIIPVYNTEKYIGYCIESVISQTYGNLEILLINDGSTDKSLDICYEYAKNDKRICVINKENGGPGSARIAGILKARGEYVLCVDGDDWIEHDTIEKILCKSMQEVDIYAFAYYEEHPKYRSLKVNNCSNGIYRGEKLEKLYNSMIMEEKSFEVGLCASVWGKLVKREIYKKNQITVPTGIIYGEDAACIYSCVLDASSISVDNTPYYHYRIHSDSIVHGYEINKNNFHLQYMYMEKLFKEKSNYSSLHHQLILYVWHEILLKSYENIESDQLLFPYEEVTTGKKVMIYGAGLFGQVIRKACANRNIPVTAWIDQKYEVYQQQGLDVISLEQALQNEYDWILISILNRDVAEKITKGLEEHGVESEKIIVVDAGKLSKRPLPTWITEG